MLSLLRPLMFFVRRVFVYLSTPDALENAEFWRRKGMQIGEGTHIFPNVVFGRGGDDPITIGRNCVLTGCAIIGHDASTNQALGLLENGQRSMVSPVVIEDGCFIGHGAIVLMGVRIGRGSIVGAGAVVSKDVPPGSVVAGNPARIVRSLEDLVEQRKRMAIDHPELFPDKPPIAHDGRDEEAVAGAYRLRRTGRRSRK